MSSVDDAFNRIKRGRFLPISMQPLAGLDRALPIGYDQTNSQPTTVRRMLGWLDVQPGQRVLDVGSGSGWTTALLAHIVGRQGHIYSVERIPELVQFGRNNCNKLKLKNVEFFEAGPEYGLPELAPFDRILVSASADEFPDELLDQLKIGGKMVIPIRDTIYEVTKLEGGKTKVTHHPGYVFVPLV